jgi:hypothetical protein
MNFLVFVLLVLVITGVSATAKALLGRRRVHSAAGPNQFDDRDALVIDDVDLKKRIGGMEERIRVLERITTDPATRTARDIENLD